MDEDWDSDPDQIVDLDITGDPQLDQFGYQSPRRDFTPKIDERLDYLAEARRDHAALAARQAKQEARRAVQKAQRRARRAANALPPAPPARGGNEGWPVAPPVTPPPSGPLPGQHGAYFEVRTKRVWYAPWRKRKVWQQISTWHVGQPPAGAEVVTVANVAQLPGRVHTIGRVNESGAVEY